MKIGSVGRLLRWLTGRPKTRPEPDSPANSDYTRPASWEDVIDLTRRLNRHGVRYILVGGYALAAHGYVRMTEDVDIAVDPDPRNSARWIAALTELPDAAAGELVGEHDPFAGDYLHAIRINDEFTIDLLPSVAGIGFDELLRHITHLDVDGETIPVLDLRGLLATKQGTRPKDQADAAVLRRVLELASQKDGPG
jgi:hypothetical protein